MIKTVYDIRQYLKRFGAIIYVGDRIADLQLMEVEIQELYKSQLMDPRDYQSAILVLRHEIRMLQEKQD
jgi:uncharacterized protein YqgQ